MREYRRPDADFGEFLKVLKREGKPRYLPFYEHGYHPGFIARRMGVPFDRMPYGSPEYFRTCVDFWLGIGYDCIPLEVGPNIRLPEVERAEGVLTVESDARACIRTWEEFEKFQWPEPDRFINYHYFDIVAGMLPDGVKIVGGVGGGPYEWLAMLMGVMGLSLAVLEEPELVEAICGKLGELYVAADRRIAAMDAVGALRQGDDLGFKTSTFLSPEDLRNLVFPMYKRMVAEAHAVGKPFILHSCGNLAAVYSDIIACGFDAKHSFEDGILPVGDFKRQYGARITPLGGLDVDMICRSDEATLRAYTRRHIEQCFADGYWALGSGNSLTDYMPVENYMVVIEEGLKVTC